MLFTALKWILIELIYTVIAVVMIKLVKITGKSIWRGIKSIRIRSAKPALTAVQ